MNISNLIDKIMEYASNNLDVILNILFSGAGVAVITAIGAVIDFFCRDKEAGNPQIVKAANIENALTLFSNQEDSVRRKFLLNRMMPLDLAEECTNLEEQERVKRNLQVVLTGTQYEGKMEEIIRFMSQRGKKRRREIYTGALHQFGRKDGVEIYRLLKKGLESDVGANGSGRI